MLIRQAEESTMLTRFQEYPRETLTVLSFSLILGYLSANAYFFDRVRLRELAEKRAEEVRRLQDDDIKLSAEIRALQAEIDALKTDSEETSLVARTTLGMVSSDEVVYQLNNRRYNE